MQTSPMHVVCKRIALYLTKGLNLLGILLSRLRCSSGLAHGERRDHYHTLCFALDHLVPT